MERAAYDIVRHGDGWELSVDGRPSGQYATREAAFEAAVMPASNAIREGLEVSIHMEGANGLPTQGG